MKKPRPHPHADVIKKWADGAQAQYYALGEWHDMVDEPIWYRDTQFRIKPEPKPDVVVHRSITLFKAPTATDPNGLVNVGCWPERASNITLTFDGETGKLKSAEVL